MPTVIELVQREAPPTARMSLLLNGEEVEVMGIDHDFRMAHSIDAQFAGAWLDGRRLYDTEVWYVSLEGDRRLSAYVPPRSEAVDRSYDQLTEIELGSNPRRARRRNDRWRLKHWADPLEYRIRGRWLLRADQRVAVFGPSPARPR